LARTLRLAVTTRGVADSAAAAIDAEIKRLKHGTSLVDYKRMPAFARDLSALSAAIEGPLERSDDTDGHHQCPSDQARADAHLARAESGDAYFVNAADPEDGCGRCSPSCASASRSASG
jgi:hypothetical protein